MASLESSQKVVAMELYRSNFRALGGEPRNDQPDPPVARAGLARDNDTMEPVSRPELDAKLKTVELTLDRRIDGIESKLDGLKADVASTKSTVMWMAALVVGTVVSTAALVVGSFDSGRETSKMMAEAENRINAAVTKAVADIRAAAQPGPSAAAPTPPPTPSK